MLRHPSAAHTDTEAHRPARTETPLCSCPALHPSVHPLPSLRQEEGADPHAEELAPAIGPNGQFMLGMQGAGGASASGAGAPFDFLQPPFG